MEIQLLAELDESKKLLQEAKIREDQLKQETVYLRELYERSPLGYQSLDEAGRLIETNQAWLDILGYEREEVIGQSFGDFLGEEWKELYKQNFPKLKAVGEILGFEFEMIKKDGSVLTVNLDGRVGKNTLGEFQQTYCIIKDITQQVKAKEEQKKLQEQLLQSQKLESIGQFAGGIAHDFNNMLTAIIGHAELAKIHTKEEHQVYARLDSIEDVAHRSAALVSQLLAFARKQTIDPKTLNLNDCVTTIHNLLKRVIGEDITLNTNLGKDLWSVKIDPSQVDQILTNLCVNARDAINGVGTIIVETKNVTFEPKNTVHPPHLTAGKYVQLSVSDNGAGMDEATIQQIFEPFFTTKEQGRGTGLGLSSVYGIVQQNRGFINTYSEPDIGSTFKIFLPCDKKKSESAHYKLTEPPLGNGEIILLVEDEETILEVGKDMLRQLGYKVFCALSPSQALDLVQDSNSPEFDLLITDVVMPEMNGKELANRLCSLVPQCKCLFTSGYTEDIIAHNGILEKDVHFLQKPFSSTELATVVSEILNT
ncbi:hypothetical protein LA52FAK_30000 [Desulforhopalus sp. 52FAK]